MGCGGLGRLRGFMTKPLLTALQEQGGRCECFAESFLKASHQLVVGFHAVFSPVFSPASFQTSEQTTDLVTVIKTGRHL